MDVVVKMAPINDFSNKKKTIITIMMFPILFIIFIIGSIIGIESFKYSYFYNLSDNNEQRIYVFECDRKNNIVLKSDDVIIENFGHSRLKSFTVFMLLSFYSILIYKCILLIICAIFK